MKEPPSPCSLPMSAAQHDWIAGLGGSEVSCEKSAPCVAARSCVNVSLPEAATPVSTGPELLPPIEASLEEDDDGIPEGSAGCAAILVPAGDGAPAAPNFTCNAATSVLILCNCEFSTTFDPGIAGTSMPFATL